MWIIAGTLPEADMPLEVGQCRMAKSEHGPQELLLPSGRRVPVERGTASLAGVCTALCGLLQIELPTVFLGGDCGKGDGSRAVYQALCEQACELAPNGVTFHYLFPDVDWHNRVLMAMQELSTPPQLVADAGFMYVAKMSGYADEYTLFTPDTGEMAFLADEKAPHPFYTRGFLLAEERDLPKLIERAYTHGNCPKSLIVKGSTDYIVENGAVLATVNEPSVPAMEAIGGTGDLVTALVSVCLMQGMPVSEASLRAAKAARKLAALCNPTPATQIKDFLPILGKIAEDLRYKG